MSTTTQEGRFMILDTPLGKDVLFLEGFSGRDGISTLFRFELDLLSEEPSISAVSIVGKPVTIAMSMGEASPRFFHGIVGRFGKGGKNDRYTRYFAEVVPWLWYLSRNEDSRVFQDLTVPEIVKKIFQEMGFNDFRDALTGTYTRVDYCVQHRESSFRFISRILELEGISYFFEHENGKHTLVLADSPDAHKPCPGQEKVGFLPEGEREKEHEDAIAGWQLSHDVPYGKRVYRDYHFEMPGKSLEVAQPSTIQIGNNANLEVYEYPGGFAWRFNKPEQRLDQVEKEGARFARLRMEEEEAQSLQAQATSTCRAFSSGFRFDLTGAPAGTESGPWLLTSVTHKAAQSPSYISGEEVDERYSNELTCIPHKVPYRPPRVTEKPIVHGFQTALVVGPAGEEIWTDKYGRVKVQFHWDRRGKKDENSSCWVRVGTMWAGKGWGGVHVPRIGQEVIVGFLEGDPDQPIILGGVYNADQMPPYPLPGGAMVSGLKTNSTKGGGGSNEMSMNDTKGTEMVTVHAQYDMVTTVEHDQTLAVHNNRTSTIDVDDSETVGSNQSVTVGANQSITVGGSQTEKVGANQSVEVGANQTVTVGATQMVQVGATQSVMVGGVKSESVGGARSTKIGAADSLTVAAAHTITVGGPISITSGATITLTAGGSTIIIGASGVMITSGAPIVLKGAIVKSNC